jgi:hypothetical protein
MRHVYRDALLGAPRHDPAASTVPNAPAGVAGAVAQMRRAFPELVVTLDGVTAQGVPNSPGMDGTSGGTDGRHVRHSEGRAP